MCIRDRFDTTSDDKNNGWSGYHVTFRNPRNFQEFAIDKSFNRWGDMVDYFSQLERPYKLSSGSLKDLLYRTYKRKGAHSLSLNDLVEITKITRVRTTKTKVKNDSSKSTDSSVIESDSINDVSNQSIVDTLVSLPPKTDIGGEVEQLLCE